MPEKSVTFYGIQEEFFPIAYKLVEKMYSLKERVLFLCDNEDEVNFYNSKLWTSVQLSFIPSGNSRTIPAENAKFCCIWFSTKITFLNDPSCLLHNGLDIADNSEIKKFQKIIDIFNFETIDSAKLRAQIYQKNGFTAQKLWIQDSGSWKQESFS